MDIRLKNLIGFLVAIGLVVAICYVLPITLSLGKQVFTEPEVQGTIQLFQGLFIMGLILTILMFLVGYLWKQNDFLGDNFGIFNGKSKFSPKFLRNMNAFQKTFLAVLFFSLIFLSVNALGFKQSLVGINTLPQQFTPLDSIVFSSLLTPAAENLLFTGVLALSFLLLQMLFIKLKGKEKDYGGWAFLIAVVVSSGLGVIWHLNAYAGSDLAIGVVAMFWGIMGLLSLVTGLFTIPLVFHIMNNFFVDFSRLYVSDTALIMVAVVWVALAVVYGLIYKKNAFGTKKVASQ